MTHTSHLTQLEQRIVDRVDSLCSDRPTWQRAPMMEHELLNGFVQILRDEIQKTDRYMSCDEQNTYHEFDTNNI